MSVSTHPEDSSLPLSLEQRLDPICMRFEAAWQTGQRPRIEQYLGELPPADRPPLLWELARLELAYRRRGGERPTLEEYQQRFPEQTPLFQEMFAGTGSLVPDGAAESRPHDPAAGARYLPLRHHATGGMGEVHVAEDAELHREVVLKSIQKRYAQDPESRRRFLREAEITGRLEHPGIVPVYGLVQDAVGQPSYAMRFVQGDTLREAIRRYHALAGSAGDRTEPRLALRDLLTRFVAVCNTVAYAHSQGIVHRDLKPANVMLGKYGETLVVDWGLAKPFARAETERSTGEETLAPSSRTEPAEPEAGTRTGMVAGTPTYMSPEQAAGRWNEVGPASDIYSLGATLYELLVNRPPVEGASSAEVLERARRGEVVPPRQVNKDVPQALEAVCLKAMAFKPADRYATATALANDVERWLSDEPITAYPESWPAKAGRWMRRHRAVVAGAVAAVVVLTISLALGAVLLGAANAQLWQRTIDLADEQARTQEALQAEAERRKEARETLDAQTSLVMEDLLGRQQALTEEHKQFLRQALQAYERFAASTGQEEESRAGVARAYWRVGSIRHRLGLRAEAEKAYRQAITLYEQLGSDFPTVPDYRRELAGSLNNLGTLLQEQKKLAAAREAFDQALAVRLQLFHDFPTVPIHRKDLAASYNSLGRLLREQGKPEEARAAYEQALSVQGKLVDEFFTVADYRHELTRIQNNRANLLWDQKNWGAAQAAYEQNLVIQRQLVEEFRAVPHYRRALADSYYNLGLVLAEQGKPKAAHAAHEQAVAQRQQLVQEFPAVPPYRQDFGASYHNLALFLHRQGEKAAARDAYEKALPIRRQLAHDFPDMPDYRRQLAGTHNNLGNLFSEQEEWQAARTAHEQALALRQQLARDFRAIPGHRQELAISHSSLGTVLRRLKEPTAARAAYEQALALRQELAHEFPARPVYRVEVSASYNLLGVLERDAGQQERAVAWHTRAIGLLEPLLAKPAPPYGAQASLFKAHVDRALALVRLERHGQAVRDWDRAVALADGPARFGQHVNRGLSLARLGEHTRAVADAEAVVQSGKAAADLIYHAARIYGLSASKVLQETTSSPHAEAQRQEVAQKYADRAMQVLAKAVDAGFKDGARVQNEDELAVLRPRDHFKKLVQKLDPKMKP